MDGIKIGRFLADLRKGKGYTQQNVADMLNISNKTVSRWEQGVGYPEVTMIPALGEIYEVTTDELLAGERITKENPINHQLQIKERKKYFLLTTGNRFNIFFAAATVLLVAGYGNLFLNYLSPLFMSIIGLIILLVGYFYSGLPLSISSELFKMEEIFPLKHKIFQKVFLCVMVFLFIIQRLVEFTLYYPIYYFPRIIILALLILLWNLMDKHLGSIMKDGKLFNKYTTIVLYIAITIMLGAVLVNWYIVPDFGRGYDYIFSYVHGILECVMAIVIGVNLIKGCR